MAPCLSLLQAESNAIQSHAVEVECLQRTICFTRCILSIQVAAKAVQPV